MRDMRARNDAIISAAHTPEAAAALAARQAFQRANAPPEYMMSAKPGETLITQRVNIVLPIRWGKRGGVPFSLRRSISIAKFYSRRWYQRTFGPKEDHAATWAQRFNTRDARAAEKLKAANDAFFASLEK